jgi:UDP-N-acetylmuramyl pentapeptide phosphotransferase/UDP-N-acetylglucosamine-1-phosphate transferase
VSWVALAFSLAVALAVVPAGRTALLAAGMERANYRGRPLAFPIGVAVVAGALVALSVLAPLDALADEGLLDSGLERWMVYVIGVAFLGLLDDVVGRGAAPDSPRGWRGHAAAVLRGQMSTGAIKALGSLALAAFVLSRRGVEGWQYVADIGLLLLATNAMNLLDTGPGRCEKAFALLAAGLCVGAWTTGPLELLGPFVAPAAVAGAYTLRERAMLGDTGSNVLGALAGIWLLTALGDEGRLIALAAVATITVYGEFRSIGALVERVPPLRALDSLGRVNR